MSLFREDDLPRLLDILKIAGEEEILPRFRSLQSVQIAEKRSSIDLVTEADLETEKRVSAALKVLYPSALIVGEEACEADAALLPALGGAELAFVIDPVDGTFNFQAGLPVFGINLAVVTKGETVAGLIHDPVVGDTLLAVRGGGARQIQVDGTEAVCRVAEPKALENMVGTISINDLARDERRRIAGNLAQTKMAFAYNCSAYEYWLVATGKVHFIGHYKLMPWDHLAGVLLHQEAGGHTAKFDGSPYCPGDVSGGILSAPDKESWAMIRERIILAQ